MPVQSFSATSLRTPPDPIESLDVIWARAKGMAFWDLGKLERDKWREMFDPDPLSLDTQTRSFRAGIVAGC